MPLYEYQCQSCDRRIEVVQRFADAPLTLCETCGGALRKLVSAPAFQFKGSGWYQTDYARKGSGEGKAKDGEAKDGEAKDAKSASSGTSEGSDSASKTKESASADKSSGAESSKPAKTSES